MPRRSPRPCRVTGCPNLVRDPSQIYCEIHAAKMERSERERRNERGTDAHYGREWERISQSFLRFYSYCEICGKKSEVAHHIVERAMGGSDEFVNLMALCRACHTIIHNKRISIKRGGYGGRGIQISGSNRLSRAGGNRAHIQSKLE